MPGDQVGTDYKLCHALEMRGFQIANSSSIIQKRRLPIPHTLMDQKCFSFPGLYVKLNHLKSSFTFFSVYLLVEHQISKSTIHFASLSFSKQVEKHYRDGTKEIIFPDQRKNACLVTVPYKRLTWKERELLNSQMDNGKLTPNAIK